MADPRFFTARCSFSLSEIADRTGASLVDDANGSLQIDDVASLESAGPGQISFCSDRRHSKAFLASQAGACLVSAEMAEIAPAGMALLVCSEPRLAYALIASAFYPEAAASGEVSAAAHIAPSAGIGEGTSIGPGVVIEADARIGPGCVIGANSVIGHGVTLGSACRIANNVSITHSIIGDNVIVHSGARLGADGFGYVPGPSGLQKIPQLGRLIIHDDVEIGANTCIDRGTNDDTIVGAGTKIDNLVQIGHNCRIGRSCILCGQSGLAGSVTLGDGVVIGGQVAVVDHCHIEDGARVGGKSGVTRAVPAGAEVVGYPAKPAAEWRLEQIALKRLGKEIQTTRTSRKSGASSD